jgi:DNA-binding response OmpR family regulator
MKDRGVILIVEDEESIAEMLRTVFEREGYRVRHSLTGRGGVDRVRSDLVTAVLLDLNLPDMDGVEVCREIRKQSPVPIIMLTARDTEIDKVVGLEIGADDYVTKPFSPRELMARVRAVLRRTEHRETDVPVIGVGAFEIDRDRREVRLRDAVIRPTAREFDLLWYLAENRGMALSRAQILQAVWGYDYFGETRTVDVHIRQLRRKIDGIPIETVWGIGYRLGD